MLTVARDALSLLAEAIGLLGPYWGLLAVALILAFIGEGLKQFVTPKRLARSKLLRAWDDTKMFHPPLAGAVWGLLPGMPLPPSLGSMAESTLYYGAAGVLSVYLYDAARRLPYIYKLWRQT